MVDNAGRAEFVFETERLGLRRLRPGDEDLLLTVVGDPSTMVHFPRSTPRHIVEDWVISSLDRYDRNELGLFSVWLSEPDGSECFIGDCGFLSPEVDGVTRTEIGYHLGREFWNRGYATEAVAGCLRFAAEQGVRDGIISLIRPQNLQSRRVAEKNGAEIERTTNYKGLQHLVYRYTDAAEAASRILRRP